MEYRVTITVAEHGHDPANGERVLGAFLETHPDAGPAVMQNTETGALSVTFSFEAEDDAIQASNDGARIFADGMTATGLAGTPLLSALVELVREAEEEEERLEPVPA